MFAYRTRSQTMTSAVEQPDDGPSQSRMVHPQLVQPLQHFQQSLHTVEAGPSRMHENQFILDYRTYNQVYYIGQYNSNP